MAVTGWKDPGTIDTESIPAATDWTNPGYAATSNDQDATNAVAKNKVTYWLRCSNFGFTTSDIPTDATILGIEVDVECACSTASRMIDSQVYLCSSSGRVGNNGLLGTYWPTGDAYLTHGGGTDMWGTSLVDTDIRASTFGVHLSALCDGNAATAYIDHVRIRVYYQSDVYKDFSGTTALATTTPNADINRFSQFAGTSPLVSNLAAADLLRYLTTEGLAALATNLPDADLLRYLIFIGTADMVVNTSTGNLRRYAEWAGNLPMVVSTSTPDLGVQVPAGDYWSLAYFPTEYWGAYWGHQLAYKDFTGSSSIFTVITTPDILRYANYAGSSPSVLSTSTPNLGRILTLSGTVDLAVTTDDAYLNRYAHLWGTSGLVTVTSLADILRYAGLAGQVDITSQTSLVDLLRIITFAGSANLVVVTSTPHLMTGEEEAVGVYISLYRRRKRD